MARDHLGEPNMEEVKDVEAEISSDSFDIIILIIFEQSSSSSFILKTTFFHARLGSNVHPRIDN